jgi:uncharacterized 2Fe-2S/4Fe-4S cluster protein (DUF4445 family)
MSAAEEELEEGVGAGAPARVRLQFSPSGIDVKVPGGVTVFDAASWNGIAIDSTCGGHGTCRKCKVQITEGEAPLSKLDSRAFTADELRDGWRLACRIQTAGDLSIEVPPLQTRPKAATVGVGRQVILRPSIVKRFLQLEEATLSDQRTDIQRVLDAMDDLELTTSISVLRTLGKVLRSANWEVTAVIADSELIAVEPGDTTGRRFAIAYDLGTTTVVANLLDIETGTPVAVKSMLNKQQPFGADVISRISATMMDPDALEKLRDLAHETLAELTEEVLAAGEIDRNEVYEIVLAGNATMTQIALGIDPEPLGVAPFVMTAEGYDGLRASELGISIHPNAPATVFPSLGAYVGGDITAGILATGLDRDRRLRLFIDVGTNCEIAIGNQDRIVSTAAPAGPAFEAASIRCGMRAADGAIEVVKLTEDAIELGVIGDAEPVGMCGSGLVDAVAELVRVGMLDSSGKYLRRGGCRAPARPRAEHDHRQRRARLRPALEGRGRRRRERRLPVAARRPRAPVREGRDRNWLAPDDRGARHRRGRHRPGAPSRLVRLVPLRRQRDPHRPRAEAADPAHHQRRQRRGRGREDGDSVDPGAPRRRGPDR